MKQCELKIDKTWTLFLDRDGVINLHYPNDYVKKWDEFYFLEGVLEALQLLSKSFKRILLVTNQQGVGKGLMSREDLDFIHDEMLKEVRKYGGRIHAIYAATDIQADDTKLLRKPNTGMAKLAKKDFPELEFEKAVMVGDSGSDMRFGKNAEMKTVFIGDKRRLLKSDREFVDYYFDSLIDFANALTL